MYGRSKGKGLTRSDVWGLALALGTGQAAVHATMFFVRWVRQRVLGGNGQGGCVLILVARALLHY